MNETYDEVPNDLITGKDLDYLSDAFQWNYGGLKSVSSSLNSVEDKEIKDILNEGFNLFNNNITSILSILGGKYE